MLAVVAIADFMFQYRAMVPAAEDVAAGSQGKNTSSLKATPHIKGRIRQLRHARMKKT